WLPLIVLLFEAALHRLGRREVAPALALGAWAGAALGVLALGAQPQLTFYAGLFLALWTLGPALEGARLRGLARWAGLGAWSAAWAVGLFAVQLLPTAEAARESTRAVSGAIADPLNTIPLSLISLPGPLLANETWEHHGGLGFLWAVAAALAPFLCRGRVRFQAAVAAALVVLAVAGPLLEGLPVFRLFREPPRMLMFAALPISLLAGTTTEELFAAPPAPRWRRLALVVIGLLLLGVGLHALALHFRGDALVFRPYWAALAVIIPAALWLPGRLSKPGPWRVAWVLALLLDLWALALPLVEVRPESEVYAPTATVDYLAGHAARGRVLDRDAPANPKAPTLSDSVKGDTPLGFAQPLLRHVEAVRGLNPFDVRRYTKYMQFIADRDAPVDASGGVVNFEVKNRALLDLLGTRYLVQPSAIAPEGGGWEEVARDPAPVAFGNVAGGMQTLPPYTTYENNQALPRAFVVPEAAALPASRSALAVLKETDFRRTVLLEPPPPGSARGGDYRSVEIREYRPNRVALELAGGPGGYLVLTDVWFPGWTCAVDGRPAEVARADYTFRGVAVPDGAREVVFRFEPDSYRLGKRVTCAAAALLAALTLAAAAWPILRFAKR
ncbi:MAG TPA: hypothetical protein VFW33_22235, partial [Gemmataceae bacterium]|nr:hypothetical protein [Gemmataceae bacterium]